MAATDTATEDPLADRIPEMEADELAEWYESLDDVAERHGADVVRALLSTLSDRAAWHGISLPSVIRTPYLNSLSAEEQPDYPSEIDLERRLENLIRWNAMAMVARANRDYPGIGGHLSSFASICTLFGSSGK